MSVIGIDFGDESLTVAAVRNGGIDVLQNEIGKRKTRSMVSYTSSQRFIADDAISHYLSNSANSVVFVKRLLGKMFDDVETAHEQHFSPARLVADDSGRVAIAVKYLGEDVIVTPEEVVATLLAKIKRTCRHCMPDQEIADCVIAIPHYFTDTQRRAMLDAARMAGLNVLRLVNDITAVATQYGMRRTFTADETRLVVFYDIGVCSTDVALASISGTELQMLAITSDHTLGGRDFDELLVTKLAADIKNKYKLDVFSSQRALLKLRKECDRIKQILSANSKVPYTIEYLMDDKDVSGTVTREEFETLIGANFKERLAAPLERVLAAGKVTAEQLHSLEMLGGGTRIPYVQTLIREMVGRDLSKTCDADESVCWGATLHCAMLSPSFKVKPYEVREISAFPISVDWKHDPTAPVTGVLPLTAMDESIGVFAPNNVAPSVKIITIREWALPLQVAARYGDHAARPQSHPVIARFAITPPADAAKAARIPAQCKIKLKMKVDGSGLLSLLSAQALLDGAGKTSATRVDLTSYAYYPWNLTDAAYAGVVQQYTAMDAQDQRVQRAAEAVNALEGFILAQLNRFAPGASVPPPGVTPQQAAAVHARLKEEEAWLEDNEHGPDGLAALDAKLAELKKLCNA
jgi:heat shock protein 4